MPQDMTEDTCSGDIVEAKDLTLDRLRPLTYDEKKAAEAAFRGDPFNPVWSAAAARVYAGIVSAMAKTQAGAFNDSDMDVEWMAGRSCSAIS